MSLTKKSSLEELWAYLSVEKPWKEQKKLLELLASKTEEQGFLEHLEKELYSEDYRIVLYCMFLIKESFKEEACALLWKKLICLLDSHPVTTEYHLSADTYFWHTKKINAQEPKLPYSNNIVFRLAIKTAEILGELESEEIFEKAAKYCHNMFKKVVIKKEEDALYPCMWIVLAYSKNSNHRAIVNTIIEQLHFPKRKKGYQKTSVLLLMERDIRRQVLISISKAWAKYPELPIGDANYLLTAVKDDTLVLEAVLNNLPSLNLYR